jgi:hypothetical protein
LVSISGPVFRYHHEASELHKSNASHVVVARRASKRSSTRLHVVDESIVFNVEHTKSHWGHVHDSSWISLKERYIDNLYDMVEQAKAAFYPRYHDDPGKAFQSAIYTKVYKDARSEPIHRIRKVFLPMSSNTVSVAEEERPKTAVMPPSRQGKDRFTIAAAGKKTTSQQSSRAARDNVALECAAFESRYVLHTTMYITY